MNRTDACYRKLDRVTKALRHEEPDRVPVSDSFWGQFIERWKSELRLPEDTDIYQHYDLDWMVTVPNMDPHVKPFELIRQTADEVVVRTGFEAEIRKVLAAPMPEFLAFGTDTIEKAEDFQFDDPFDGRRYRAGGDNQIAGVGDGFARDLPPWVETIKQLWPQIPVFGSVCEGHELGWRIIGSENMMLWMGLYPDRLGGFLERVNEFNAGIAEGQIEAADGLLDGMVIWGDVAYRNGMLFSPLYWRKYLKPGLARIAAVCRDHGLPIIYHGCGDTREVFPDLIEIGIEAVNPLEAKAGMDVVELRREYGHLLAFCGNMNVLEWAQLPMDELRAVVLTKLNAAKGGGFIFQSDHSVPASLSGERYEYVVNLVRERGTYPLELGEYDLPDLR